MDKRDNGFQNTESSAKKAISRVKSDPDNSGRSGRMSEDRQDGETRRLARPSSQESERAANSQQRRVQTGEQSNRQARPAPRQGSGQRLGGEGRRTGSPSQAGQGGEQPRRQARPEQRQGGGQRPEQRTGSRQPRNEGGADSRPRRRPEQTGGSRQDGRMKPESRSYIPLEDADESRYSDIRINKKMRMWNKYKNYVFAAAGIIILIIIVAISVRSCSKDKPDDSNIQSKAPSMGAIQPSSGGSTGETQPQPSTEPSTPAATQAPAGAVLTTTRTAAAEEFTNASAFDNSIFIGDSIASGISYYRYLDGSRVIADTNLTVPKALDRVGEIASANPDKVYIMLGLNDLNYNSKTVDSIAKDFDDFIGQIKQSVPSAKIYVVSVTPITKACESRTNIYITMSNIEALNNKLKESAAKQGTYFVDINTALQDSSGYLNSDVTGNGYNMKSEYYGFMLNTIAEMTK